MERQLDSMKKSLETYVKRIQALKDTREDLIAEIKEAEALHKKQLDPLLWKINYLKKKVADRIKGWEFSYTSKNFTYN
jgi:hypothetical protein